MILDFYLDAPIIIIHTVKCFKSKWTKIDVISIWTYFGKSIYAQLQYCVWNIPIDICFDHCILSKLACCVLIPNAMFFEIITLWYFWWLCSCIYVIFQHYLWKQRDINCTVFFTVDGSYHNIHKRVSCQHAAT